MKRQDEIPEAVVPGIYRLPLASGTRGSESNAYLVRTDEGDLLVDTGWNTEASLQALERGLAALGAGFAGLRCVAVTHCHLDHIGGVRHILERSDVDVLLNPGPLGLAEPDVLAGTMNGWMQMHGSPALRNPEVFSAVTPETGAAAAAGVRQPAEQSRRVRTVRDGECLRLGDFTFEVLWTPGHTDEHICLYEPTRRVLLSGDHVLQHITPSVDLIPWSQGHPLERYLASLDRVAALNAELVLPGHGAPFSGLRERVAALRAHHRQRGDEILSVLRGGGKTAYDVASEITWSTGGVPWQELPEHAQVMSVWETLAHLDWLAERGCVTQDASGGRVFWALI